MVVDVHTHPVFIREICNNDEDIAFKRRNFGLYRAPIESLELFKCKLNVAGIDKAVLLPVDLSTGRGGKIVSNEDIMKLVELCPDIFVGFGSLDPNGPNALQELENIKGQGLKGLKLNPSLQCFFPNDKAVMYPIYEKAAGINMPIIFHSGMTWDPGCVSKYSHPLLFEEVALDFPELRICLAHFGWPWVSETAMLAVKYENVYTDTAMLYFDSPREFFDNIFQSKLPRTWIDRSLNTKVLFGSNYPRIDPMRMKEAVDSIGLKRETLYRIYDENIRRFIGIGEW